MLENNSVHLGDCLELMKDIPDKSIDMILCDLPYGTTACKWDVVIPFDKLWEQYHRIIKDNGAIVLTASQPFTTDLINSNRKNFKYELIWEKSIPSGCSLAKSQPMRKHENIYIFAKNKTIFNPQLEERDNAHGGHKNEYTQKNSTNNTKVKVKKWSEYGEKRNPTSILKFKSVPHPNCLHPTQKPVALFEYLIKTYTNEGDTVLDNCAGSGTTAIAAINTNRNYILMEKEQKYYDIINKRIAEHTNQVNLF